MQQFCCNAYNGSTLRNNSANRHFHIGSDTDPTWPPPMTTPTHWLSYNPNASDRECETFAPALPVKETDNLSQQEISRKLFEEYLAHYKSPELGEVCRLEDFKLEDVQALDVMAQRYQVDFVSAVEYSVQVKEEPTMWMWGRRKLSSDGWIIDKFLIIGVSKVNNQYILKLIGTGP